MNSLRIATLTALTLTAGAGFAATADVSEANLEWQQPGYVTEVVVVTASRPEITTATDTVSAAVVAAEPVTPAWQEPGYVQEVVVVTASRDEYLEAVRARLQRQSLARRDIRRPNLMLGVPTR